MGKRAETLAIGVLNDPGIVLRTPITQSSCLLAKHLGLEVYLAVGNSKVLQCEII